MHSAIKLDGTYYKLKQLPTQTLANQMASKIGQGTSEYGDLTTWSAWIEQDWQRGVGKLKPHIEQGGLLYSEAESRVPGQLILGPYMYQADSAKNSESPTRYIPPGITGTYTVGPAATIRKLAWSFTTPSSWGIYSSEFTVKILGNFAQVFPTLAPSLNIYTNSAGNPGTDTGAGTSLYKSSRNYKGLHWYSFPINSSLLSTSTTYWFVIEDSSDAVAVAYGATGGTGTASNLKAWNGSSWTTSGVSSTFVAYTTNLYSLGATTTGQFGSGFFRFNSVLYCFVENKVWKWDGQEWDSVGTITDHSSTTVAVPFDTKVYFGNGGVTTTDYTTMSTAEAFTSTGVNASTFAKHNGFLWRAYTNYVEYSSDGTTWEPTATFGSPIEVTDTDDVVVGMCGMGDNMYVATKQGLCAVYPGDASRTLVPWGGISPDNGLSMINFEGALYIVVNGRVVRYTEDGTLQDVWVSQDDAAVDARLGRVYHLTSTNNWLLAIVGPVDVPVDSILPAAPYVDGVFPTIWAYHDNAWHHIATLPACASGGTTAYKDFSVYYDRTTDRLWATTPDHVTYYWYIPNRTLNPYNDSVYRYAPTGWVEWDWFDSPIQEASKDYESIKIIGENFSASCYAEVYWKDDDSTDWELLGTCTTNKTELRWTVAMGTRPNTTRFKLGMLLRSTSNADTPKVQAIRVKYHLMVRDWFRWNLIIDVAGRSVGQQEMDDGTRNTALGTTQKAALDALCKRIPPLIYQDVDGTQYEVKVIDANFNYTKYDNAEHTSNSYWEGVYNIVIEQVTQGTYA